MARVRTRASDEWGLGRLVCADESAEKIDEECKLCVDLLSEVFDMALGALLGECNPREKNLILSEKKPSEGV